MNSPEDAAAHMSDRIRYVASAAPAADGGPPRRVLIAPWGDVRSRSGPFVVDAEAARLTVAAFEAHGADLPIDYEHQSLGGPYASPNGQAPAAGWIKRLIAVPPGDGRRDGATDGEPPLEPGLWADVDWTPPAVEQLAARQYRYLSPVALVRRSDRRMIGLHSAALTNKPAIAGIRPVVNAGPAAAPGADADRVGVRARLCDLLSLDEGADDADVVAAAGARIAALQGWIDERGAVDRVAAASAAGKLTPAQRGWALDLARRDAAAFDAWLAHAPIVVSTGRTPPPIDGADGRGPEAVRRRARREYRAGGAVLAAICSEEAFVRDALRQSGAGDDAGAGR